MVKGYDCISICFTYFENMLNNVIDDYKVYFSFGRRHIYFSDGEIVSNSHGLILKKLEMFGIKQKFGLDKNVADSPVEYIKKMIDQGKSLIICCNTEHLTYRNIFVHNAAANHYFCVKGYDEGNNKLLIFDGSVTSDEEEAFEGYIDLAEVLPAWEETEFDHIIWDKSYFSFENMNELVHEAFVTTIKDYLVSVSDDEYVSGEEAIRSWVEAISEKDDMDQLLSQLKVDGVITLKQYILQYLEKEMGECECVESYRKVVEGWRKLCMLLFFMKLRKRYGALDKFKSEARALIDDERRILQKIIEKDE